ncbi:unnamed protein product [Amoebophrya sp. A120]|nr:unnamed protein product [Amoebophrya sp. A120]|eukprot:GSA120T00022301001.1
MKTQSMDDSVMASTAAPLSGESFHDDVAFDFEAAINPDVTSVKKNKVTDLSSPLSSDHESQYTTGKPATKIIEIHLPPPPSQEITREKSFTPRYGTNVVFDDLKPIEKTLSPTTLLFTSVRPGAGIECWKICNKIMSLLSKRQTSGYEMDMKIRGTTMCVSQLSPPCAITLTPFQDLQTNRFAVEFRRESGGVSTYSDLFHSVKQELVTDPNVQLVENDADEVSTESSLDLNLDWMPDFTNKSAIDSDGLDYVALDADYVENKCSSPEQLYSMTQCGYSQEAAELLKSVPIESMNTKEFWMTVKLLLGADQSAIAVNGTLNYCIQKTEKNPVFGVQLVEVGLGRMAADLCALESCQSMSIARKAMALLNVLAHSLWQLPKEEYTEPLVEAVKDFIAVLEEDRSMEKEVSEGVQKAQGVVQEFLEATANQA